ncbi:hypothetical protein Tco_1015233 [Tanacetum coccineum]|uniref:Myb-like domain-containing protein n=1 Tax=Tanacetum coccineum TaxID=301880 RepID=A0ABQ5FLJ6_9ASTR
MSQNPNEQGYFTNLMFNPNSSYQQETGSNPSTPSSQHSFQQYPGFEAFQQLQPKPRFKEPQPQPPKDNRRGKRVAKRATVDLVDENEEEEEHTRQCARWTRDEEILLTECWIETSENGQIGADRIDDSFWGQIMDDFNSGFKAKLQAGTSAYETKKQKELAMMEFKEWSTIDADQLLEPKASIIRRRQEIIIAKYAQK